MFTRIMSVVLAVILLLTVGLSTYHILRLQEQQVSSRLEELKREGREIAWLAARNRASTAALIIGMDDEVQQVLSWKGAQLSSDYGAYVAVVDRRGRLMDNYSVTLNDDPDFAASLSTRDLSETLGKVLEGQEISLRSQVDGQDVFTVGVPFLRDERVLGAVLIYAPAARIAGNLAQTLPSMALLALAVLLAAGVAVYFSLKSLLKPLRQATVAAKAMAEGDFSARVAEQKAAPELRELSQAFNAMADKLEATEQGRREFVANVSHELRSPITAISGFVQGMEDGTIPPEDHPKYLALVGEETRRLSKLIQSLLDLSRLEREDATLSYSDFDICEMLRRAIIRRVSDLESRHMDVVCDFTADPCYVHADQDRMEQVVVNLVDNAIKFTPDSGRITLSTAENGDSCTVTVADNGVGISPEDRPRVFERFFTADRAHTAGKGTGLGLSICQRILEMHGQRIRLLDTEEGAAFAFTLQKGRREPRHGTDREPAL